MPRRPRTRAHVPIVAACVALAASACGPSTSNEAAAQPRVGCRDGQRLVVAPPARGSTYLGAFPFLGNTEDRVSAGRITGFERLSGRQLAWVYVSDNWLGAIRFPGQSVATIRATGAVPFIRLMPRSSFDQYRADPRYSMASIVRGRHDEALQEWARAAARVRGPLMVEFGTEVNGAWFPWNGRWNGGATTTRYGDPSWPDGPERFRDAYRHVVRLFRAAGARNVTWVFHVDSSPEPEARWNDARWYWPGEAFVDWIGLSAYGPQTDDEDLERFDDVLSRGYASATRLSRTRPIALLEFAIADDGGGGGGGGGGGRPTRDEAAWTRDAFDAIESGRYPRLRGVAWWHERWTNDDGSVSDLRIDSSPALLDAYRASVADPRYVSRVRTHCR